VLDRDYKLIKEMPSSNGNPIGLFFIAEVDETKYIMVTVGNESLYEIEVALSKEESDAGVRSEIYGGVMQFQGQKVPLQVLLFFTKSNTPDDIIIDVFNSSTLIKLSGLVQSRH